MTKIPLDEILESLYKLRILESDQLKTVLELYHMEIHQKITIPNYQKLKSMVKRCKDVKPVNVRVLSLLNSVQYDSSLMSFSAPWQVNSFLIPANYLFYEVSGFVFLIFFGYAVTVSKFSELFSFATTFFFPELILHKYSLEG